MVGAHTHEQFKGVDALSDKVVCAGPIGFFLSYGVIGCRYHDKRSARDMRAICRSDSLYQSVAIEHGHVEVDDSQHDFPILYENIPTLLAIARFNAAKVVRQGTGYNGAYGKRIVYDQNLRLTRVSLIGFRALVLRAARVAANLMNTPGYGTCARESKWLLR